MRAARALLGIDQRTLAQLAGVSLPTIQRMEASTGNVRGIIDSLSKVIAAIEVAGVELIGENSASPAGGDRKSVVEGKRVSVRVDLGGRSIIKKKNTEGK